MNDIRYQTAVEGLQVIAGGDGDAAEIAVQTLDMLRVQTEQPEKPEAVERVARCPYCALHRFERSVLRCDHPFHSPDQPEAVETGEPVAWRFCPECDSVEHCGKYGECGNNGLRLLRASPIPDGEARRKALESELRRLVSAAEAMITGVSVHNRLSKDSLGRLLDIEGPVVKELHLAAHAARAALAAIPTAGDAK